MEVKSGKILFFSSAVYVLARLTISDVKSIISCINSGRESSPCSIWRSLLSQSPVMDGEASAWMPSSSVISMRRSPRRVTRRSRPSRSIYFCRMSPSIVAARVAGVPSPRSDIASRRSSSSMSLPAPSMAESRVASLKRAGGLVSSCLTSMSETCAVSPSETEQSSSLPAATPGSRP